MLTSSVYYVGTHRKQWRNEMISTFPYSPSHGQDTAMHEKMPCIRAQELDRTVCIQSAGAITLLTEVFL